MLSTILSSREIWCNAKQYYARHSILSNSKWYNANGTTAKQCYARKYYARTPILSKENNSIKKIMPQYQVLLVLKFIFLFRNWIPTIHPAYHRILTYLILLSLTFLVPLMKLYWIKVFNEFFGSMYISMYSEKKSKSLFFLNPPIRVIKHRQL